MRSSHQGCSPGLTCCVCGTYGTTKVAPFQNRTFTTVKKGRRPAKARYSRLEAVTFDPGC
jgi:hypothetical protein